MEKNIKETLSGQKDVADNNKMCRQQLHKWNGQKQKELCGLKLKIILENLIWRKGFCFSNSYCYKWWVMSKDNTNSSHSWERFFVFYNMVVVVVAQKPLETNLVVIWSDYIADWSKWHYTLLNFTGITEWMKMAFIHPQIQTSSLS